MTKKEIQEMIKRSRQRIKRRKLAFRKAMRGVTRVNFVKDEVYRPKGTLSGDCGDLVRVRPCAEEFKNKTFLGIFVGEIALGISGTIKNGRKTLNISRGMHNPMIYIPSIKKVVFGCGSWWSKIKSEKELSDITDETINDVWYVRALKQQLKGN